MHKGSVNISGSFPFFRKFKVEWSENDQVNYILPDDIVREKEILVNGTRVNVIAEGKAYYDEMVFTEYMDDGNHLMQTKKGAIVGYVIFWYFHCMFTRLGTRSEPSV